jgi:hypothetical protein
MSGASMVELAEILGHRSMQMVRRYAHMNAAHVEGIVQKMVQQFLAPE